jgi:type IV secretion system protein VirB10
MILSATILTCFALAALQSAAQAADIPPGAHMLLRMENSLSTRTAKEGDYVYLKTASPISADGQIIVPVGSYVQGVVAQTKRSGRVTGRAELAIRLETLTFAQGKVVKFAPHLNSVDSGDSGQKVTGKENVVEQGATKGKDAERIAILAGTGASIGGIADRSWKGAGIGAAAGGAVGLATVLLTRGKEVELRQGSTLDVVFDRPVALE